jgi:predicted enzyme related to lactoylglutathione lyase
MTPAVVSIAAAVALGAAVVVPKAVLPDGDTMAVLVDPTGLAFGLCALAAK